MARAGSRRRSLTVFSLSFLDAMTCGFGAVVLLYMVINAAVGLRTDRLTGQLQAEAERLDAEVLDGHRRLVELKNSLREIDVSVAFSKRTPAAWPRSPRPRPVVSASLRRR